MCYMDKIHETCTHLLRIMIVCNGCNIHMYICLCVYVDECVYLCVVLGGGETEIICENICYPPPDIELESESLGARARKLELER